MKATITTRFGLFLCFLFLFSCSGVINVPIEKNKVASDVKINFTTKNLEFKQNDLFNLSNNGLEANSSVSGGNGGNWLKHFTDVSYTVKAFKKKQFINYDVLITSPKYPKPYYGKIAFFNTTKKNSVSAVARYREISIADEYFSNATRGRTAIMYEYANFDFGGIGKANELKMPTWILLMSDEPF